MTPRAALLLAAVTAVIAGTPAVARAQAAPPAAQPPSAATSRGDRARQVRDAQVLIRQGKYEDALARLRLVPLEGLGVEEVVQMQGLCLRRLGRLDEAADLFRGQADASAARGGDPIPMLIELERVHREAMEPEKAFEVCLEIHRTNSSANPWILDEIESLVRADSLSDRVVTGLQREIERRPDAQDLRDLLVGAYLFIGRPDEALRGALEIDRARGAHGSHLLEHARFLAGKELGEPLVNAADLAIAEGLKGDDLQEALLLRADGLRRAKRPAEAVEAYRKAAEARPSGPLARVALRNRAEMTVRDLHDVQGGAAAYQELVRSFDGVSGKDRGRLLGQALVALSDCELQMGRYEEAAEVLKRVEKEAPDATSREEAAFQQAEILFYAGQTDTAQAAYSRVVQDFIGGVRVNDALDRILTLTRAADAGAVPLAALGQIAYQKRIGAPARALEICETARRECGDCAAQEDILREQTTLLIELGRLEEAAAAADTAAVLFTVGGTAPALLRSVADAMRARDGDTERVMRRYEDLIVRFPKSQEAIETRGLLEKIRRTGALGGGPGSEHRG